MVTVFASLYPRDWLHLMATLLSQQVAERLWEDHINFQDCGGRKPLPFYGIREVHRDNLNQVHADKLWQEYVNE